MGWMEVKVISDVVLTVGGLTVAVLFLRQVYRITNYLAFMADFFCVLTTHTQPDTLRQVIDKGLHGGPTFLEDAVRRGEADGRSESQELHG